MRLSPSAVKEQTQTQAETQTQARTNTQTHRHIQNKHTWTGPENAIII